jgi:hypothetical protein
MHQRTEVTVSVVVTVYSPERVKVVVEVQIGSGNGSDIERGKERAVAPPNITKAKTSNIIGIAPVMFDVCSTKTDSQRSEI